MAEIEKPPLAVVYLNRVLAVVLVSLLVYVGFDFWQTQRQMNTAFNALPEHSLAAENADLAVVELLNYNCDWSRALHTNLMQAVESDGRIRYIPRPIAHGDAWNIRLASAVYAAGNQGKFIDMHNAVIEQWPVLTDEKLFAVAAQLGLDTQKLSREMQTPEILGILEENQAHFSIRGLNATPVLLVGTSMMYISDGKTPDTAELVEKFGQARQALW